MDFKKANMFKRIINSDATIKLQQRNEIELNENEKLLCLEQLYNKNKKVFLEKYFNYLSTDDVFMFDIIKNDPVVDYYLSKICEPIGKKSAKVKNRRYEALQRLIRQGDYFDDESMKSREPLLYEQMIGKYEKHDETTSGEAGGTMHLTDFLMKHLENVSYSDRLKEMRISEGIEESEEEEEEEEEEDEDEDERVHMRDEFVSIMHRKFLDGEDLNFDYRAVDFNDDYDNIEIVSRDLEEKYFDQGDNDENNKISNVDYDY
jgi:hypothetical protein